MRITIFDKKFESCIAWGIKETDKVEGRIFMTFNPFKWVFFVYTPNHVIGRRNPIKAIATALEKESVGMQKYTQLKEIIKNNGFWKYI